MSSKRSQILSMDLILGLVIFVSALAVFFSSFGSLSIFDQKNDLDISGEIIFSNIESISIKDYDFLTGYRINSLKMDEFANLKYDSSDPDQDMKSLVLSGIDTEGFSGVEFCIYLEDKEKNIIRHIGQGESQENTKNLIKISNDENNVQYCGSGGQEILASSADPQCKTSPYIKAYVFSRPVIFNKEIVKMNVIICARD